MPKPLLRRKISSGVVTRLSITVSFIVSVVDIVSILVCVLESVIASFFVSVRVMLGGCAAARAYV